MAKEKEKLEKEKLRELRRCLKCGSTQTYLIRDEERKIKFRRCRSCGFDDMKNATKIEVKE